MLASPLCIYSRFGKEGVLFLWECPRVVGGACVCGRGHWLDAVCLSATLLGVGFTHGEHSLLHRPLRQPLLSSLESIPHALAFWKDFGSSEFLCVAQNSLMQISIHLRTFNTLYAFQCHRL